ncbi:uncharacterized protein I303_106041 [Kwoniella dejecticola CBS 10117]|uniref:Copper-fist domain-containing protein n=1 Tax=Kwoniella dejecticola CBS 10117 TaxID=1296121 RepID=A0A1A6A142_9TREE|nr:uncharacterized protein I303_06061 [Kwoniella dejecticola CBS 10117]OBR83779.1 hypothetical protein I303_06061 [Kwoniella dejecticola CBS 10117]
MVLINEKKYACEKCIKGHRVSGCTHTDRPLYEIKKKGRPTTQCSHCKDKRKAAGSSVHTKCACGDVKNPPITSAIIQPVTTQSSFSEQLPASEQFEEDEEVEIETRKGQPGSKATFPRGFKDVLELAAAANALAGLVKEDTPFKVAERSVQALLNPCKCQSGGPCKCCHPKKAEPPQQSGDTSPSASGGCCSTSNTSNGTGGTIPPPLPLLAANPHLSPNNMHHPAHTSPHVHKTKLFSPYSTNPASQSRYGRRDTISSRSSGRSSPLPPKVLRSPPPTIKPLTDFGRLIGAAINQDGSINPEIPRSAVGLPNLPGIATFDTAAENGGTKVEPMEYEDIDIDMPLAFPTSEDVVIGAFDHDDPGHQHEGGCGESCKGRHDCHHSISVPSGVTSIAQLISLAASHVPPPPEAQTPRFPSTLDPHDMRVLPPSAQFSADVARSMGIVQLKPLECCNGRCQCPPGQCTCEKECCGCCVRCACSEEDEDARMSNGGDSYSPQANLNSEASQPKSSCCGGKQLAEASKDARPSPLAASPIGAAVASSLSQPSPTLLSPDHAQVALNNGSRQPSPVSSGSTTPVNLPQPSGIVGGSVRRAISISSRTAHHGHDVSSSSHRRATVTGNPPAIAGHNAGPSKTSSKAIAPYNAQHHRTILPKASNSHLSVNTAGAAAGSSRQPSPSGQKRGSGSTGPTRTGSPTGERRTSASNGTKGKQPSTSRSKQSSPPIHPIPVHDSTSYSTQPALSTPHDGQHLGYQWPPQYCQEVLQSQYQAFPSGAEAPPPEPSAMPYMDMQNSHYPPPSQNVMQDPNIDPSNAALLAFLQQYTQANYQSSQAGLQYQPPPANQPQSMSEAQPQQQPQPQAQGVPHFDESWYSQVQQPALSHDISGTTSPEIDQPFDLDQFLAQTLGNRSQPELIYQPSSQQQTNDNFLQHQQGVTIDPNPNFNDFFFNAISSHRAVQPQSQSQPPHQSATTNHPGASGPDKVAPMTGPPFIPLVPGLPAEHTYSPNWTSNGAKEKIVQDQRRLLSEINAGTSTSAPAPAAQAQSSSQMPAQVQGLLFGMQGQVPGQNQGQFETDTGDMIDLSKPLNSDTLNKIMMALQKHNDALLPPPGSSVNNSHNNSDISGSAIGSALQSAPSMDHNNLNASSSSHVMSASAPAPAPAPQRPLPLPLDLDLVDQSTGMGMGIGSTIRRTSDTQPYPDKSGILAPTTTTSTTTMMTKDLDDMFSQFVTLDGVINPNLDPLNTGSNTNGNAESESGSGSDDPNAWLKIQCNVDGLSWASDPM